MKCDMKKTAKKAVKKGPAVKKIEPVAKNKMVKMYAKKK